MPARGETAYHQTAKAIIQQACQAAGWSAELEVIGGDGWRADVLAVRGSVRIAFEVQWSFLRLDEALARQERYAQDGVRGCWFFRHPPAWMLSEEAAFGDQPLLKAWKRLPLFHLYPNLSGSFAVGLNGRVHPLAQFIPALLDGRIHHCGSARADAGTVTQTAVRLYEARCPACGSITRVHTVTARLTAGCGLEFPAPSDVLTFHPDVLAALGIDQTRTAFTCRTCGSRLDEETLGAARYGIRREPALEMPVRLSDAIQVPAPHWCWPPNAQTPPCCE
ncbi:MAG: hypothetical protein U0670_07145 [Anaerolineae bacterium]